MGWILRGLVFIGGKVDKLETAIDKILTSTQRKHYGSIKWLTGPTRKDGKTFAMAMAFTERAIRTGELVYLSDHSVYDVEFMFDQVQKIVNLLSKETGVNYKLMRFTQIKAITVKPE